MPLHKSSIVEDWGQKELPISGVIAKILSLVWLFSVVSIPYIKSSLSPAAGYKSALMMLSYPFSLTSSSDINSKISLSSVGWL